MHARSEEEEEENEGPCIYRCWLQIASCQVEQISAHNKNHQATTNSHNPSDSADDTLSWVLRSLDAGASSHAHHHGFSSSSSSSLDENSMQSVCTQQKGAKEEEEAAAAVSRSQQKALVKNEWVVQF